MAGSGKWLVYSIPLFCVAVVALALYLLHEPEPPPREPPPTLHLLASSALRPVLEEMTEVFQRRSGIRVELEFAGPGLLVGQLREGRPYDVCMAEDVLDLREAAGEGLVGDPRPVASLVPVLQISARNPKEIGSVADLARPDLKLALADADVLAVGRITPAILNAHDLPVETLLDQVSFTAANSLELGQAVALGHADAALVWHSVALQFPLTRVIEIAPEKNSLLPVATAPVLPERQAELTREFLRFLSGSGARDVFRRHQYGPPEEEAGVP